MWHHNHNDSNKDVSLKSEIVYKEHGTQYLSLTYDVLILTEDFFVKLINHMVCTNQINGQKKIYKCTYKDVQRFIGNCFKKRNISIIMSLLCDSNLTSLHFVLCHLRAMQLQTRVFQIDNSVLQP